MGSIMAQIMANLDPSGEQSSVYFDAVDQSLSGLLSGESVKGGFIARARVRGEQGGTA